LSDIPKHPKVKERKVLNADNLQALAMFIAFQAMRTKEARTTIIELQTKFYNRMLDEEIRKEIPEATSDMYEVQFNDKWPRGSGKTGHT